MYKRLVVYIAILACLLGATGLRAQSVFYSNTIDDNFYFPVGTDEIAMPIAFTGAYEVDSFTFGYFLPLDSVNGPTTDVTVNFYTAGPAGDVSSGYDPVNQYYPNLVSSTNLTDLPSDPTGKTNVVSYDLTTYGDFFDWTAMPLLSGETGGYVSLQFSNPDAGWELATGDSQDDYFQDVTTGNIEDFGGVANGNPQAAFYIQLSGQQLVAPVPEPGIVAALAGLLAPGSLLYLWRRNRRR